MSEVQYSVKTCVFFFLLRENTLVKKKEQEHLAFICLDSLNQYQCLSGYAKEFKSMFQSLKKIYIIVGLWMIDWACYSEMFNIVRVIPNWFLAVFWTGPLLQAVDISS